MISRRNFIKGLLAVTATTAVANSATISSLINNPQSASDEFRELAKTGVIEGRVFYIDEPLELTGFDGLLIHNCVFVATTDIDNFISIQKSQNVSITGCTFERRISPVSGYSDQYSVLYFNA